MEPRVVLELLGIGFGIGVVVGAVTVGYFAMSKCMEEENAKIKTKEDSL